MTCTDIGQEMFALHERLHLGWEISKGPHRHSLEETSALQLVFLPPVITFSDDSDSDFVHPILDDFERPNTVARFAHLEGLFLKGQCERYCGELQHAPHVCP